MFLNRVKFNATSGGTGALVVSTAVADFKTPSGAGISDQAKVSYTAWLSGSAWECGIGTYSSGSTSVSRDYVRASSSGGAGGAPISFASPPIVWFDVLDLDFNGGVSQTYLGQVATHTRICDTTFATGAATNLNSRTYHIARDDMSTVQVQWAGWYLDGTGLEQNAAGASGTVTASIEYPAGTFTQIKFGGITSGTLSAGGNLLSDVASVSIPRGSAFWVRSYQVWSNGGHVHTAIANNGPIDFGNGEACNATASDQTMSGSVADGGAAIIIPPVAIIGPTSRPSFFLLLDSRVSGLWDSNNGSSFYNGSASTDSSGDFGEFARGVGSAFAYINAARAAAQCASMVSSHTQRVALAKYCSHVLCNGGINDLATLGSSASTVQAAIASIAAFFPGKPVWQATLPPLSTSTNTFLDVANQTTATSNAARVTVNTAIRALGIAGLSGYIEIADVVESARDSGLWAAPGVTQDGTHESQAGNLLLRDGKACNPFQIAQFPANTQIAIDQIASHVAPRSFRNVLRGDGGFEVWQRGAGAAASIAVAASTTAYGPDKWYLKTGASQAAVVAAFAGLMRNSNLGAFVWRNASQTGTGTMYFARPLDTPDILPLRGKLIALSFSVLAGPNWSPANGALNVNVYFGTGAPAKRNSSALTNEVNPITGTANLKPISSVAPGSILKFAATSLIPVPVLATQGEVQFSWAPVGTAGALDYFMVDDVQLEPVSPENPVATPFERLTFDESLAICQEWYEKTFPYSTAPAQSAGTAGALNMMTPIATSRPYMYWHYKRKKRPGATVTVTTFNPSAANANWRNLTGAADVAVTLDPSTIGGENGVLIGSSATVSAIGSSCAIHAAADCSI